MDIDAILDNGGYDVRNPNYNPKTKKGRAEQPYLKSSNISDVHPFITEGYDVNAHEAFMFNVADYDKYINAGINLNTWETQLDWERQLAERQSGISKLAHGVERALVSEVGIGSVKAVSDLFDAIGQAIGVSDGDYTNPVSQYLAGLQKDFEELTPIYSDPNKTIDNGGLFDAGWWANNIPSIASSLTLLIPSTGIVRTVSLLGKLNRVQRFGNNAVKFMRGTKYLNNLAKPKNLDRLGRFVENGVTGALSRTMENYQEAQQVYEDTLPQMLDGYVDSKGNKVKGINDMSDAEYESFITRNAKELEGVDINNREEVAKALAHNAATRTFKADYINTVFDIIQLYGLRNTWKGLRRAHGSSSLEMANQRVIQNAGKTAEEIAKIDAAKGFLGKRLDQLRAATKGGYKTVLAESTEGIEEAINYIAQQEGTHLGQYFLNGSDDSTIDSRLVDYITAPQLWDSAFWGFLGGVVFQGLGSSFKRIQQKIEKGLSKKDETVEDVKKKSWWQLDDLAEIKRRKSNIEYQGSRLDTLFKQVDEINAGRNPFANANESSDTKTFAIDTEEGKLQQELARERAINDFIDDVIMTSANNGNIDYLRSFLESNEVREAMVNKKVISQNEAITRQQELVNRIDEIEDMFDQEVNQLNDIAGESDLNIPVEYLQIIANNNVRRKLAIQQYQRVSSRLNEAVKRTEDLVKDKLGSNEQGKPNMYRQLVDLQSKVQELSVLYANKKRIEGDKNLSKTLSGQVQLDDTNKKIRTLERELFSDASSYDLGTSLFVRMFAPRAIWKEDGTLAYDNSKESVEALDQVLAGKFDDFLKEFGSTKLSSNFDTEQVKQRINVLTKDIERVTGKDSELDEINPTLKSTYQQLSAINTAILYEQAQLTHTVSDVTHYANMLHNTMSEARANAVSQAIETLKSIADKYPDIQFSTIVDNANNNERVNELINNLSVEDRNKFMEQMQILDLTRDSNIELGVEVANILAAHQFEKIINDAAEAEGNGESSVTSQNPPATPQPDGSNNQSSQGQQTGQGQGNPLNGGQTGQSQQGQGQTQIRTKDVNDTITALNNNDTNLRDRILNATNQQEKDTAVAELSTVYALTKEEVDKVLEGIGTNRIFKPATTSSTGGQDSNLPPTTSSTSNVPKSISVDDTDAAIQKAAATFFKEHIASNTPITREDYNRVINTTVVQCEDESYANSAADDFFKTFTDVLSDNAEHSHLVKDIVMNSSLQEVTNVFTEAYKKAVENLIKAYVKAAGIKKVNGEYHISLEHLLKYCNSLSNKNTNSPAKAIFSQLRDYLINDKPKGYVVYDLNDANNEGFLNRVQESVAERVEKAKKDGMQRVGIRSYVDYLEDRGVSEKEIDKVIEEIDKIVVGDALTYDINGKMITIKHNGVGIGSLLIPSVAGNDFSNLKIAPDALIGETGGWRWDTITNGSSVQSLFGDRIIKILNSNDVESKAIVDAIRTMGLKSIDNNAKDDYIKQALKNNNTWNKLVSDFGTKASDFTRIKTLSSIFVYGELANSLRNPGEAKTATDSFNQWLIYLNNSYEKARYLVDNPDTKIEVASKFRGEQNTVSGNEAKPVGNKGVIADKYKGRIRIGVASNEDSHVISTSASDEIPAKNPYDGVTPHSTFVIIPDGNGNHSYVHAYPAKLSDSFISNEMKTIKSEIRRVIFESFTNLYRIRNKHKNTNSDAYSQQDYLNAINKARSLIIKLLDNNINANYGNLNVPLLLGLRVNRSDNYRINIFKTGGEQFSFSVTQSGQFILEINHRKYNAELANPEYLTNYIMSMIERNCCFNIGHDYVKSDNNKSVNLPGLATRTKDGKFQVKIGDFAPHIFNDFNDFIIGNNLVKVTTYVGANGDNFNLVSDRSQLTNGTVHYKISGQESSVNPPVEESAAQSARPKTKSEQVIDFINTHDDFTGEQIAEILLGKKSSVLKDLVDKGLLPGNMRFDNTLIENAAVSRKTGEFRLGLGFVEILNKGNYKEGVRKLIHERLHNLIEINGETDRIRKDIREIYDAFVASNPNKELAQYINWNENPRYWDEQNKTLTDEGIEEFFIESVTAGELARYLNSVQSTKEAKYSEVKEEKKSLWQKIIDVLVRLLGRGNSKLNIKDNTLFAQEMLILSDKISNIENENINNIQNEDTQNTNEENDENKDNAEEEDDELERYDDLSSLQEVKPFNSNHTDETLGIKLKAISDGTFMKAPNGNPTNLTERQWLQVRTKDFKDWFGDWESIAPQREFKNSLFRGQAGKPIIDKNGNLILHPTYDNLSKNTGISFSNVEGAAISYGSRYSKNPYIIEIDADYLDKTHPLKETAESKGRFIGDEYGENAWEERISDTEDIIIPKGYYKIKHDAPDFSELSDMELRSKIDELKELYNNQDEWADEAYASRTSKSEIREYQEELNRRNRKYKTVYYDLKVNKTNSTVDSNSYTSDDDGEALYQLIYNNRESYMITEEQYKDIVSGKDVIIKAQKQEKIDDYVENSAHLENSVSKVVDENGEPLVVYHRSLDKITDFSDYPTKKYIGSYFSVKDVWTKRGNNLGEYFLNIKKPFITDIEVSMELGGDENWINHTKQNGFDGAIGTIDNPDFEIQNLSTDESVAEIIAFNPNQIKSATDNNGEFSTESNDINYSSLQEHSTSNSSVRSIIEKLPPENQANMNRLIKDGVINMSCR